MAYINPYGEGLQDQATQYQLTHANVPVGYPSSPITYQPVGGLGESDAASQIRLSQGMHGITNPVTAPTTESGNQLLKWQLEHPGQSAPSNAVTPLTTGNQQYQSFTQQWGGQPNTNPVTSPTTMPYQQAPGAGGGRYGFDTNPVTPPTTGEYTNSLYRPTSLITTPPTGAFFGSTPDAYNNPKPTQTNPTQSNALKFSDPEASFTPFQSQTFNQPISSPFGSQQMPSFNMQSFKYPPMNPTSGGGKNWWEMQW